MCGHVCDYFYFGFTQDISRLFSVHLQKKDDGVISGINYKIKIHSFYQIIMHSFYHQIVSFSPYKMFWRRYDFPFIVTTVE